MICQTPLTRAKVKYILSPINDMQFSDRVQFETGQFHPYGPYSASTFRRTVQIETGNFQTVSDCVYWTTLHGVQYGVTRVQCETEEKQPSGITCDLLTAEVIRVVYSVYED